jgi:hypothetical protein
MTFTIQVDAGGIDDLNEFLSRLPGQVTSTAFFVFDDWGRELKELGAELSPKDKLRQVDPRRSKNTPFYLQWDYETGRESETQVKLSVGNTDPRMPFIIGPTSARAIPRGGGDAQRRKGYPMRFYWESGPAGPGFYTAWQIKGGVTQGTEGNPVHERMLVFFDVDRKVGQLADRILEELSL